eukprot:COSAG05_NODE_796_length_7262_cov_8.601284_1_plen_356_part_00
MAAGALLRKALRPRHTSYWVSLVAAGGAAAGEGCCRALDAQSEPPHYQQPPKDAAGAELVRACAAGDEERALQLLGGATAAAGVMGACSFRDAAQRTPLSHAAEKGLRRVVELLLEVQDEPIGAGTTRDEPARLIDSPSRHGVTPLEYCCWRGHARVVRLLLDAGSTAVNRSDDFGVRPLHKTVAFRHVDVLHELLREEELDINGRVGIPTVDPSYGAQSNRDTALHLAARSADAESCRMLRMLLRAGASLEVCDASGETALHAAVRASNPAAVRQLVAAGADVHATSHDGATPINLACTARANGMREQEGDNGHDQGGGIQWLLGRMNPYSKEPLRVREIEQVCRALRIDCDQM